MPSAFDVRQHRRSQVFLWGALFLKKSMTFLVVTLNMPTQVKTAKLTTPTLQLSPAWQKFPQKLTSRSVALPARGPGRVHL